MGREIKFRAWSKVNEKMWEVRCILEKSKYCPNGSVKLNSINNPSNDGEVDIDLVELMQYTGLKDRNWREIYEGDIVNISGYKYQITFEIGSFMLVRCSCKTNMYRAFEDCWNDDVYPLSQFYWNNNSEEDVLKNCEVIGNIYENSDLLNECNK